MQVGGDSPYTYPLLNFSDKHYFMLQTFEMSTILPFPRWGSWGKWKVTTFQRSGFCPWQPTPGSCVLSLMLHTLCPIIWSNVKSQPYWWQYVVSFAWIVLSCVILFSFYSHKELAQDQTISLKIIVLISTLLAPTGRPFTISVVSNTFKKKRRQEMESGSWDLLLSIQNDSLKKRKHWAVDIRELRKIISVLCWGLPGRSTSEYW